MKFLMTLIVCLFCILPAYVSANYTCSGEVRGLAINPKNGQVLAESMAGLVWPALCSTVTQVNDIPTESCKQIYNILLVAQTTNRHVTLWFNDDEQGGSCSSHPSWNFLTGWYFGPKLN